MPDDTDLRFDDLLESSFQEILCACMVSNRTFCARARAVAKPSYFSAEVYGKICEATFAYWDAYHELPTATHLRVLVAKGAPNSDIKTEWVAAVDRLYDLPEDERDPAFVGDQLIEFAQRAESIMAVALAYQDLRNFDITALHHSMETIVNMAATFKSTGLDVRTDFTMATYRDDRHIFRSGYHGIDACMRGGIREGEMLSIMGPMKSGKTIVMMNMSTGFMLNGHCSLHITLEMRALDVLRRYVSIITGTPTNELEDHIPDVTAGMALLDRITNGQIRVEYLPGKTVGVEAVDGLLTLWRTIRGQRWIPIIDYADLLNGPKRDAPEWQELSDIYIQLRNLAEKHHVPIVTVTQTNAAGFGAKELGAVHQSGSTRKAFHVDYMLAINQQPTDYAANRFTITPFINRFERKDQTVYCTVDYRRAQIREISAKDYTDLGTSGGGDDEDIA